MACNDINKNQLKCQLQIFALDYNDKHLSLNIFGIVEYVKIHSAAKKSLVSEVCTVLKLILIMTATNASCELSFSAMHEKQTRSPCRYVVSMALFAFETFPTPLSFHL